jgi:ribosomal protein S18 acetylase RimI-like enzyme
LIIRPYRNSDHDTVLVLWQQVFADNPPHNDPAQDIARKQLVQPSCFLVAQHGKQLVGTAMAGFDGHRGWVYYVAVLPAMRRRGIGKALMQAAEGSLEMLGCSKINLQVRADNPAVLGFYRSLGYAVEERVSLGKRLT